MARIGRLAVDARFNGMKLSAALLWHAIERAARSEVTVYAVAVDAKDEAAEGFYRHFGFVGLESARYDETGNLGNSDSAYNLLYLLPRSL